MRAAEGGGIAEKFAVLGLNLARADPLFSPLFSPSAKAKKQRRGVRHTRVMTMTLFCLYKAVRRRTRSALSLTNERTNVQGPLQIFKKISWLNCKWGLEDEGGGGGGP